MTDPALRQFSVGLADGEHLRRDVRLLLRFYQVAQTLLLDLRYDVFLRFQWAKAITHVLLRGENLLLRERGLRCKDRVR